MTKEIELTGPFDPGGQPTLASENKAFLGLFAWNLAGGGSITKAVLLDPERRRDYWKWPAASKLLKLADRIGFEFQVPFGRWLGHGGITRFNEEALDFLTVSAGLAPITSRILIPSTSHIGYGFHPVHFARWGAVIDYISGGRWALNVVAGWIRDEVELFGGTFMEHDLRYEMCDEFTTFIKQCWHMDEPFDFEGRFYRGRNVRVSPKPARQPRPFFVNAGHSSAGMDYAAKDCYWLFSSNITGEVDELKGIAQRSQEAAGKYSRTLRLLLQVHCTWAETDEKAEAEFKQGEDLMDEHATGWFVYRALDQPGTKGGASFAAALEEGRTTLRAATGKSFDRCSMGLSGRQIVGSYDSAAEHIRMLYTDCNIEGFLCIFMDPFHGLHQAEDHLIPRLKKMGLRK